MKFLLYLPFKTKNELKAPQGVLHISLVWQLTIMFSELSFNHEEAMTDTNKCNTFELHLYFKMTVHVAYSD